MSPVARYHVAGQWGGSADQKVLAGENATGGVRERNRPGCVCTDVVSLGGPTAHKDAEADSARDQVSTARGRPTDSVAIGPIEEDALEVVPQRSRPIDVGTDVVARHDVAGC